MWRSGLVSWWWSPATLARLAGSDISFSTDKSGFGSFACSARLSDVPTFVLCCLDDVVVLY